MPQVQQVINSPVFTVNVVDDGTTVVKLKQPVQLHLKQSQLANRTGVQCVYWQHGAGDQR